MPHATLDAYLFHLGNCREAMAFYQSVFGGDISFMDMPGNPEKVMHSHLTGGLINLMGSDGSGTRTEKYGQGAVSLSITCSDESAMRNAFAGLSEDAAAIEELSMQPWGDLFGSLTDKYGIDWLFSIPQAA